MIGTCHCGQVSVTIKSRPEYINICDCSLCLKSGGAWGYFASADVTASGDTSGYRRADYEKPAVEIQFCAICGATTHWVLTENFEGDRVGVNMRLFEPKDIEGIEAHILDGRGWFGETNPAHRCPSGKIGIDLFL